MFETLLLIAIGVFIGWNVERPEWSRTLQTTVVTKIKELLNK